MSERSSREAEVREWRAILEADDTASLHNEHQRALCDSWLAQAVEIRTERTLRELAEVERNKAQDKLAAERGAKAS